MPKCIISGKGGFLGRQLSKTIKEWEIVEMHGDTRCDEMYAWLDRDSDADYFFHFGSPSSQLMFQENLSESISASILGTIKVCQFCKENNIKLIFPSSFSIYGDKVNNYAYTKLASENIIKAFGVKYIIFRIAAAYGNEACKGKYASFMYKAKKETGKTIEVWGDGEQRRDFISAPTAIKRMLGYLEVENKTIDICSGRTRSFNEICRKYRVTPMYIKPPTWYAKEQNGYN
jgi:nucleoside-diphosphate-sugar epimerase